MRRLRIAAVAGVGCMAAGLVPAAASAHGFTPKEDLPVPRYLFAWAAAAVLVASFFGLAALWTTPRLQHARERALLRLPRALGPLAGALGVAIYGLVVWTGFAGYQLAPALNLATNVVYVFFWVGLAFASFAFGDVFAAINPWRAVARAAAWLGRRTGVGWRTRAYPAQRLGRWPAAAGILLFAWLELVFLWRDRPAVLAGLALAYAAVQLAGMAVYGIEPWERHADAFAVYFGLFARLSPLRWERRRLWLRPPLSGLADLTAAPGTVALLCVMIGTTSFDGFGRSPLWQSISGSLRDAFAGTGANAAYMLAGTVGMTGMVALIALLYRLGVSGMHRIGERLPTRELAGRFVHSLVPIALAYVIAHYFSLLVFQGQSAAYLISNPLGTDWDLFGTAGATIDLKAVAANTIWYVQVGALVVGHVCGLTLAHDRALSLYRRAHDATRSQYWMLAVMVCFTCLGLWILSAGQ